MRGLGRQPAVRVMKFVLLFVVVVHFGQHGNAAVAAAAMVMLGEFVLELANDAGNNQGMLGGQKAAIAARRVQRSMQKRLDVNFVSFAAN